MKHDMSSSYKDTKKNKKITHVDLLYLMAGIASFFLTIG